MTRPTFTAKEVADQSGAAILEIGERLDEVAPRPLLDVLWDRLTGK